MYWSIWSAKTLALTCTWCRELMRFSCALHYHQSSSQPFHCCVVHYPRFSPFSYDKCQQQIKCKVAFHYLFSLKAQWAEVSLYCFCIFCAWTFKVYQLSHCHSLPEFHWNTSSQVNYTGHMLSYVQSTMRKYITDSSNSMSNSDFLHFK